MAATSIPLEGLHGPVPVRSVLHTGRHQRHSICWGSSRRDAIARVAESVGGRLESFYFAFGDRDAYVIVDLPDNESATAVALTAGAAGGATVRTVVLLSPEEVDAAAQRSVDYRPPGA